MNKLYLLDEFSDIVDLVVNNEPKVVLGGVLCNFFRRVNGSHFESGEWSNEAKEEKKLCAEGEAVWGRRVYTDFHAHV